jgi:hypothetical protein
VHVQDWLSALLVWGIYPAWLLAAGGDYLCHRRTRIEQTSGAIESWLHVAQFGSLAAALACALMLQMSTGVFVTISVLVLTHSILTYTDVRYTYGRRPILPAEQTVHGFMDVLPIVAVALLAVQHWAEIRAGSMSFALDSEVGLKRVVLLSSFMLLAGLPVFEELLRTLQPAPPPVTRGPVTRVSRP